MIIPDGIIIIIIINNRNKQTLIYMEKTFNREFLCCKWLLWGFVHRILKKKEIIVQTFSP